MLDITRYVNALNLPERSYVVIGGGILVALGLREMHDVDILVTPEIYDWYERSGKWQTTTWAGQQGLRYRIFEIGTTLHGYSVQDLIGNARFVEGIPYLGLELVYCIKQHLNRSGDMVDLGLMKGFEPTFCAECMAEARQIVSKMYATT